MTIQQANYRLKNIIDQFGKDYETACAASLQAFVASSKGGDMLPMPGHIYGNDHKERFEAHCRDVENEAVSIVEEQEAVLSNKLTEAPTADAVNIVQMLALRDDLTEEEVNNLLAKYGDNVQTFKAIVSVAASKGLHNRWTCPQEEKLEDLRALAAAFHRTFTLQSAEVGHASTGFLEMLKLQVDSALHLE